MTSKRPERDFEGAGVNIGLAVAGVVAAGVGLLTMHTAFTPLPKPGVPVVISHSVPAPTQAAWRHAPNARPAVRPVSTRSLLDDDSGAVRKTGRPAVVRHQSGAAPVVQTALAATTATVAIPAAAPKPALQTLAKADVAAEKLCKTPSPQLLSAKSLQPAMILRYDAKFKASTPDIAPERPPSDDEQRRLKLSALLANVLAN